MKWILVTVKHRRENKPGSVARRSISKYMVLASNKLLNTKQVAGGGLDIGEWVEGIGWIGGKK